jgi:hypothetical protein
MRKDGPMKNLWHRLAVVAGVLLVGAVAAAIATPAIADGFGKAELSLAADVDHLAVTPGWCTSQSFQLQFGNIGDKAVYADAFLDAPAELVLSRRLVSSYLPGGYTLKVAIVVTVPIGTPPGDYTIAVRAGTRNLSVPVSVAAPPANDTGNLARFVQVTASSEKPPVYPACGAFDGDRDSTHWASTTGWNDNTKGVFPDWLQVTFDKPETVGRVDLYTLDSKKYPANKYGLKDWDVEVQVGGTWQTVAQVRNNTAGLVSSTFPAVTADALRLVTLASNEGPTYSRVVELEAYPF